MIRDPTTTFDRTASVSAWRAALLNRGGVTPADVAELQDHLESLEEDLLDQLEPEEAFWVAAHRVGTPDALTREFGKIQANTGWLLRIQWLLLGVLAYWLLLPIAGVVVQALVAALASVQELRGVAAVTALMAGSIAFVLSAGLVVALVRAWSGQPEVMERTLYLYGLADRWVLILAGALFAAVRYGSSQIAFQLVTYSESLLWAPDTPAPLQSTAPLWDAAAWLFSFLLPALLVVAVVRIQQRRQQAQWSQPPSPRL